MPISNRGTGGPRYTWGNVPNTGHIGQHQGTFRGSQYVADTFPGPAPPGAWQWRGHGPTAWNDYGWEFRGGSEQARGTVGRTEAEAGGWAERRMAEQRSGGLPRGRGRYEAERWGGVLGSGRQRYGRDFRGRYDAGYGW
jgi:hypothetical protein